jgi:hypothetical protein
MRQGFRNFLCLWSVTLAKSWPVNRHRVTISGFSSQPRSSASPNAGTTLGSSSQTYQDESGRDFLLIDWDRGCVADTSGWRINCAYKAAALVWPEWAEIIQTESMSGTAERKTSWLTNKLKAISWVLDEDTRYFSATAQHVLAVRLLLEEQALDHGQSPGTGKYGSLYHPRRLDDVDGASNDDERINGSRPLTVGEITSNWCELLLDTLPIKYGVLSSELEYAIDQVKKEVVLTGENADLPSLNTGMVSMLVSTATRQAMVVSGPSTVVPAVPVVTVRHESDIAIVKDLLSDHFKDSRTITIQIAKDLDHLVAGEEWSTIFILHKTKATIPALMTKCALNRERAVSTIHVVESSWIALQRETFHANHPVLGDDNGVGLNLFAWSPTPEMERRATMCPWSRPCTSTNDLEVKLGLHQTGFE